MASAQLAHWIRSTMKKCLKYDVHRQNRHEERMKLGKFKRGKGEPDEVNFTPYRLHKRYYYD